jgi:hypothetical protein
LPPPPSASLLRHSHVASARAGPRSPAHLTRAACLAPQVSGCQTSSAQLKVRPAPPRALRRNSLPDRCSPPAPAADCARRPLAGEGRQRPSRRRRCLDAERCADDPSPRVPVRRAAVTSSHIFLTLTSPPLLSHSPTLTIAAVSQVAAAVDLSLLSGPRVQSLWLLACARVPADLLLLGRSDPRVSVLAAGPGERNGRTGVSVACIFLPGFSPAVGPFSVASFAIRAMHACSSALRRGAFCVAAPGSRRGALRLAVPRSVFRGACQTALDRPLCVCSAAHTALALCSVLSCHSSRVRSC